MIFVLALPFIHAEENKTLSDFFKETIENKSGGAINENSDQTVFTFDEVIKYAIYLVVGLFFLVGIWIIYRIIEKGRRKGENNNNIK